MKCIIISAGIGALVSEAIEIKYEEIPNFTTSTAPGHRSSLVLGHLNDVPVAVLQGRFHLYEGYTIHQVWHNFTVMQEKFATKHKSQ